MNNQINMNLQKLHEQPNSHESTQNFMNNQINMNLQKLHEQPNSHESTKTS